MGKRKLNPDETVQQKNNVAEFWNDHYNLLETSDPLYHGMNSVDVYEHFKTTDHDHGEGYQDFIRATQATTKIIHITQRNRTVNYMALSKTLGAYNFHKSLHQDNTQTSQDKDETCCKDTEDRRTDLSDTTISPTTETQSTEVKTAVTPILIQGEEGTHHPTKNQDIIESDRKQLKMKRRAIKEFWSTNYQINKKAKEALPQLEVYQLYKKINENTKKHRSQHFQSSIKGMWHHCKETLKKHLVLGNSN